MDESSARFQREIAIQPPEVRAEVFAQKSRQANKSVNVHTRRIRGLLQSKGNKKVTHGLKTFVEVAPNNFALFKQVMGRNMVWFAVNSDPGHLHTLIMDQAGQGRFHHNTYGTNTSNATITGNYTQYSMGVQLTDREMDRFVRYLNAARDSPKSRVFGYYNRNGNRTARLECTNWATSAPIGELPRWARTLDRRLLALADAGELGAVPEVKTAGGLHAALAAAGTAEARQDLLGRLSRVALSKWNRSSVKRLAKAFQRETADFPRRPADLVLRASLAATLGLNRSKDPAKWSFDLLVNKRVPVVAVLNGRRDPGLAEKTFNWEIMGLVHPDGTVSQNRDYSRYGRGGGLGVIPNNWSPYGKGRKSNAPR
jgi:hypothetical protein